MSGRTRYFARCTNWNGGEGCDYTQPSCGACGTGMLLEAPGGLFECSDCRAGRSSRAAVAAPRDLWWCGVRSVSGAAGGTARPTPVAARDPSTEPVGIVDWYQDRAVRRRTAYSWSAADEEMGDGQTRSKGRQRPPRLSGGAGRGRSRCCRAVLALAGLSGPFAHIVPTRPQSPVPLNPCKLLILLEPASGLEPLTC